MKKAKPNHFAVNEHLEHYLKSSYLDRLNWLEEVNKSVNSILTDRQKRLREKMRRGQSK